MAMSMSLDGVQDPMMLQAPALSLSTRETAEYVESLCGELVRLAEHGGLGFLAYLLEVAREEARLHCPPIDRKPIELHGELPPPGS